MKSSRIAQKLLLKIYARTADVAGSAVETLLEKEFLNLYLLFLREVTFKGNPMVGAERFL